MLLDGLCTREASTWGEESRPFLPSITIHVNMVACTHTGVQYYNTDHHFIQSETYPVHILDGGTEVHHQNFALRSVSSRLLDAHSLQVVGMLLLDGPTVLAANESEDVYLGLVDVLCKQHQLLSVINHVCKSTQSTSVRTDTDALVPGEIFLVSRIAGSSLTACRFAALRACFFFVDVVVDAVVDGVVDRIVDRIVLEVATRLGSASHVAWAHTSSSKLPATAVFAMMS